MLIAVTTAGLLTLQTHLHHRAHDALLAAQLRSADDAAISAAIHDLNGITPHLVSRLDGSPVEWLFEGHKIEIRVQDEDGKIDLNLADRSLLRRVFIAADCEPADADAFADRIMDWRERGAGKRLNGAKQDDYAAAGLSYGPREAPFLTVGELNLVLGMTESIFQRVSPALTVYSETPAVDQSVAPALSLMAVSELTSGDADAVLAARDRASGATAAGALLVVGHAFTISAVTSEGLLSVQRTAIVRLTQHAIEPEWVYRWK